VRAREWKAPRKKRVRMDSHEHRRLLSLLPSTSSASLLLLPSTSSTSRTLPNQAALVPIRHPVLYTPSSVHTPTLAPVARPLGCTYSGIERMLRPIRTGTNQSGGIVMFGNGNISSLMNCGGGYRPSPTAITNSGALLGWPSRFMQVLLFNGMSHFYQWNAAARSDTNDQKSHNQYSNLVNTPRHQKSSQVLH
jgi:hypothetical protein